MQCAECGQDRADLLPRYGAVTVKQAAKPECHVLAGEHCQTCLGARQAFLTQCDASTEQAK